MGELKQSAFVTVVAWLAILSAGYAAVAGIVQVGTLAGVPDAASFLAFAFGRTVLACAALACAFGLLRRREWARKGMVAVLAITVALVVGMALSGPGATSVIPAVAAVAVMAWLAARLSAHDVKAEFG